MQNEMYYLKTSTQIEPLINQWNAYPLLVSPVTAAMVTNNYQLPTMKSFVKMPNAHIAALRNPDMMGGAFIRHGVEDVPAIQELISAVQTKAEDMIELATAIKELTNLLLTKANGIPLEALYREIPPVLKGFVELAYDLENRPTIRFIESLIYRSNYFRKEFQSIALSEIKSDDRPFVFSTPRLKKNGSIHLDIPFDDYRIEQLVSLRKTPQNFNSIRDLFGSDIGSDDIMRFLTQEQPRKRSKYDGTGVRMRYFGHACVLLETSDVSILVDPLLSYEYESELARFSYYDLPEHIDYVLLTHAHHDHVSIETLLQLRGTIGTIVVPRCNSGMLHDPSLKLILNSIGFSNVFEIDELQEIKFNNNSILSVPFFGEHCDLNIRSKSVYAINLKDHKFAFAADSSALNPDVYRNVQKITGNIDTLFIGLECTGAPLSWGYGALFPNGVNRQIDQIRRSKGSDSSTAIQMIEIFGCKEVYLYAMGLEPWLNYCMAIQHGHSSASDEECLKMDQYGSLHGIHIEKLFGKKEKLFAE